jgi:hypothetical protein
MIKIPYKDVPYICQDILGVLLEALFVEIKDTRLISLADPSTNNKRVISIRGSAVFEDMIKILDLFGENDFVKLITPKLIIVVDEVSLGMCFIDSVEDNFKEII